MSDHNPEHSGDAGQTGADAPVTLATVVDCLGPGTVAMWAAPHGLGVPVRTLAVYEGPAGPGRSGPARPEGLLLGIGTGCEAGELICAAAGSGASAVIVKDGGDVVGIRDAGALGKEHGVAVLALAADQNWTDLIGRLRALLAVRMGPGTGRAAMFGRRHDLVSLANSLSRLVNGSVMIFTPSQELLAASRLGAGDDEMRRAAVLDQHGPAGYRARLVELGVYRRLWSGSEVVDVAAVPEMGAGRRLAAAVRAGTENLGSIWVAEGAEPLAGNAAVLLAEAAAVAVGVLLGLDQEEVARRRRDEELFGRALLGDVDPRLAAAHLAVEPGTPVSVMVADLSVHGARLGPADLYRAREEALRHLAGYRWRALATTGPSRVVLALVGPADRDGMRRAADGLGSAVAEVVGFRPRTGIGHSVRHLEELPASRMEAELVVRALARRGEVRSACLEDVRGTANLLLLGEAITADRQLQEGPVHRLRAHDQRRGTAYTETLAAYLDAFGDTAAASRQLNVHANTLRYRIGRIRELTGLDLGDSHERLNAAVQLFALGPDALVVEHEKIPKTSSPSTNRGGTPGLHTADHDPATGTGP
ncbi:PucR family transcriptional regulator [Streptomyces sp. LN549]|uniref:PucR family transcriptional regulator n=1 Tax=Streptomyces sp. LN549 TaxID=3112979 RepID=UPI003717CB21